MSNTAIRRADPRDFTNEGSSSNDARHLFAKFLGERERLPPPSVEIVSVFEDRLMSALHDFLEYQKEILKDQRSIVQDQKELFQSLDQGRPDDDLSLKDIPTVQAFDSSVWSALLGSGLENIQLKVDRWQVGLGNLLIFIGLFSAVVTAFFVQSLQSLRQDEAARTNDLLANLTDIVIAISGISPGNLSLRYPEPFKPNPDDVRLNVYWALALILSISTAALAVTGQAFLVKLEQAHGSALKRLTVIHRRWLQAKPLLGPFLEGLPILLVAAVALFIFGLFDNLYIIALGLLDSSLLLFVACIITSGFVAVLGAALLSAIVHGCINPGTSPFKTTLSESIGRWVGRKEARDPALIHDGKRHRLTGEACDTFHMVLQETHKGEALDEAAAGLLSIMKQPIFSGSESLDSLDLSHVQFKSFDHLLSPEVGLHSNLAAANAITRLAGRYTYKDEYRAPLIQKLIVAARRVVPRNLPTVLRQRGLEVLWDSDFMKAITHLVRNQSGRKDPEDRRREPHWLIQLLSASYPETDGDAVSERNLTLEPIPKLDVRSDLDLITKLEPDTKSELEQAYVDATRLAFHVFIRKLRTETNQREGIIPDEDLDNAISRLNLGCCGSPTQVQGLLRALFHRRDLELKEMLTESRKKRRSKWRPKRQLNCEIITSAIVRWLGSDLGVQDSVVAYVSEFCDKINPYDPYLQSEYEPEISKGHNLMIVVRELARSVSSFNTFTLCVNLIHKLHNTHAWTSGGRFTLALLERLLTSTSHHFAHLRDNSALLSQCMDALSYALDWLSGNYHHLHGNPELAKECNEAIKKSQWLSDCHNNDDMRQRIRDLGEFFDVFTSRK